jgi:hypothetical protein
MRLEATGTTLLRLGFGRSRGIDRPLRHGPDGPFRPIPKGTGGSVVMGWIGSDFSGQVNDDTMALAWSLLTNLAGMPDGASVVRFDPASRTVTISGHKDWR